jgi:hypothetical protein
LSSFAGVAGRVFLVYLKETEDATEIHNHDDLINAFRKPQSKSSIKCIENSFNIPEMLHEDRRTDNARLLSASGFAALSTKNSK